MADVVARTAAIRRALASVPYIGTPEAGLFVSDSVVARHDALVAALDATDGLDCHWLRLSVGSVAAIEDERGCWPSTTGSSARPPTAAASRSTPTRSSSSTGPRPS